MKRLFFYYSRYPHEILRMRMRMRMAKFMRISADAELRYTSNIYWVVLCKRIFVEPLPYFLQDVAALDAEETAPDNSDDCL